MKQLHAIVAASCLALPVISLSAPVQASQVQQNQLEESFTENSSRLFTAYEKQGTLYIQNQGASSADIYVNGKWLSVPQVFHRNSGQPAKINIDKLIMNGTNQIEVKNIQPKGASLHIHIPYPTLTQASPKEAGFSAEKLQLVDKMIQADIDKGFPGAALVIVKDGKIVKNTAYGFSNIYSGLAILEQPEQMQASTMFDLASNTKMYATNYALQKLASEGKLQVTDLVQKYIPEFKDQATDLIKGKDTVRIIDILHHSAGFPADPQYHNPKVAGPLYSQERDKTLQMISKTPLQYEPGTKHIYSDVDYMILGYIVEKVTGQKLDAYVEQHIYGPLGLKHTKFNPLQKGFRSTNFAATELMGNTRDGVISFPNIRTYTLRGEVHDEKAFYAMGGVSGHAGLFSNTDDLAILLQVMLNGGGYGDVKLFDRETVEAFLNPSERNTTYGLGWRRNADSSMSYMFGRHASRKAVGHTGWTGTVTIIDPKENLAIALLTNKKHSPLVDPVKNPNAFAGDAFATGKYGSVITGIYEALIQ